MIVPDGRTDYEKLRELLGNPEETHLDLKASVDLGVLEDRLKIVKDIVTMSNRPPGGYILIGVDDAGVPCTPIGTIKDRRAFDGAKLGDLVRKYIEGEIHLRVQIHDHGSDEIVMVFVPHHRDGLPVPFSKDGEFMDPDGKVVTVFRPGEIWVREGAQNVRLRHAHWPDVLSEYTARIRKEAGDLAQQVIREFIASQANSAGTRRDIPLSTNMDYPTFAEAAATLLEVDNDVRLRQFLRSLTQSMAAGMSVEDFEKALNLWVIFCAQALYFERGDLVTEAIERLGDQYVKLGVGSDATRKRLSTVIRLYVIGSLAVRLEAWETVSSLALRPVPSESYGADYTYSSWIRHAQVDASRADLTSGRNGFIISAARELIVDHSAMRPDLDNIEFPSDTEITAHDVLLNSLCQFDLAYCFIVYTRGTGHGKAYPSSAAFNEDRATPVAQRIVSDADIRHRLIPGATDAEIAHAMREVYRVAMTQSLSEGGRWWGPPPTVDEFIGKNDPGPAAQG
ncbi:helix-turn-helix domain-containing protein [Mycobacterium sp. EPa45]|uniref:AlbA family DNA-binding domain-containing protein n=1 Tax=Mycobacterium sp. EPa45 TaxID=1545728 RepID=UPI000641EEF0|nr:ATP-binding protein [Mycobacterium sp. EPa45]AKK27336.1 hypothetical protein AB431_12345 [Mycobacterium sp. EPa45]